jgi:hypothetical protein
MSKKNVRKSKKRHDQTNEKLQAYAAFANHLYPDQIDINEVQEAVRDIQTKSEKNW